MPQATLLSKGVILVANDIIDYERVSIAKFENSLKLKIENKMTILLIENNFKTFRT